jgi:hypothetical protein
MHQFRDLHRTTGPRGTLAKARQRLEPFVPASHGLDVADLLASVVHWLGWLDRCEGEPPPVPVVRVLDPEAVL